MEKAVKEMDFLSAAKFRDKMLQLQIEIEKMQ
jgi:excinuclease UvrABC helicase subunit UvrB